VVADVLECYSCRPTVEAFRRSWREDAVFDDYVLQCKGYAEYAAQFYAMPLVFSSGCTLSMDVISSTLEPNQIVYEQTQEYTLRLIGKKLVVKSVITLDLDENDQIMSLKDKWFDHEPPTDHGAYYMRRLSARSVPWFVSVPKY